MDHNLKKQQQQQKYTVLQTLMMTTKDKLKMIFVASQADWSCSTTKQFQVVVQEGI